MPDVGDIERISVTFQDSSGVDTDPTGVTAKYRSPAGTNTSLTYGVGNAIGKSATGKYYVDVDCVESGVWTFRFAGTGAIQAAGESTFGVTPSLLA